MFNAKPDIPILGEFDTVIEWTIFSTHKLQSVYRECHENIFDSLSPFKETVTSR